jgi:hypothetical protein
LDRIKALDAGVDRVVVRGVGELSAAGFDRV